MFSIDFTLWSFCELLNTAGVLLSFPLLFPQAKQYYWTPVRNLMITLTWRCKIHYTAFILNTGRHTCNLFCAWFIKKDCIYKTFTHMILVSLTKWANWECMIRAINTTWWVWLQQQGLGVTVCFIWVKVNSHVLQGNNQKPSSVQPWESSRPKM